MPTLDWIGKAAVLNHHREVPYHLLKCDKALSVGDPGSGNLLVQGDNLLALKALLPYYAGKVKCIYIDPPYNTGETKWYYNDAVNSPEIRAWLCKTVGAEMEDFTRHDKWLCMMFPRLQLLRELLRDDGAIFISIDDTEVAHLRLLCDEVFGAGNFVANVIWQKKYARQNDATWFSTSHDHILVYAKELTEANYSPNWYYEGAYRFRRHLFPLIGELKSEGEEYNCAVFLDQMDAVKRWVRNLGGKGRDNSSFWLQTSTDKFYPDFVALLNDGRFLVVEYKGDRWTTDDSKEKRTLGDLWESRSNGRCLFIMPNGPDLQAIAAKVN